MSMGLKFPSKIIPNNREEYGIVDSKDIVSHKYVNTIEELFTIPDAILSELQNNHSDAIGQEWYILNNLQKYRLISWNNRHNIHGWQIILDNNNIPANIIKLSQSTGQSTLEIMSQKSVSDNLDFKATKVELKEVEDKFKYQRIRKNSVDTYNDTSSSKTSLLSQYPNPEQGWTALVKTDETNDNISTLYQWNGIEWINLDSPIMEEDIVTKDFLMQNERLIDSTVYLGGESILYGNGTPTNPSAAARVEFYIPKMKNPIIKILGITSDSSITQAAYLVAIKPDNSQVNLVIKRLEFIDKKFSTVLSYSKEIDYEYKEIKVVIQALNVPVVMTTTITNKFLPIPIFNNLKFLDNIDLLPIMPGFFGQDYTFRPNTKPNLNVCVNKFPVKKDEKFIYSGRAYWNALFIVKEDGSIVDIINSSTPKSLEIVIPVDGYLCCWSIENLRIAKVSLSYNTNQGYAINPRISLLEKDVEGIKTDVATTPVLLQQLNSLDSLVDLEEDAYIYRSSDKVIVQDNQWHAANIRLNIPDIKLSENTKLYVLVKSLNAANPGGFFKYSSTKVGDIIWDKEKTDGYYYSNIQEISFTELELKDNSKDGKIIIVILVIKNPLSPDELYISENSYIRQPVSLILYSQGDLSDFVINKTLTINQGAIATRLSAKIPVEEFNNDNLEVYVKFSALNNTNKSAGLFYNSTRVTELVFKDSDKETDLYKITIPFSATTGREFVEVLLQFSMPSGLKADTITWNEFYRKINRVDKLEELVKNLSVEGQDSLVKNTFEIPFRGYSAMTPIKVKKDGTGDFTTILDAINSIKDASVIKQYDIQVYDDYEIKDLTELYYVNNPTQKNTSTNSPNVGIALVITKNWIHVRGMKGSGNILYIESPSDLTSGAFQNIQTIYPMGNSTIDNFYVGIKGGRYAIHQESGGNKNHLDYHAHTIYKNLIVEHKGNQDYINGNLWTSVMAQANGTTSGTKMTYINCKWIAPHATPFYTHTNAGFDAPNELNFINCSMVCTLENIGVAGFGAYWGDIGSGQKSTIRFIGCNIPRFNCMGGGSSRGLELTMTDAFYWNNGGSRLLGYGNIPMAINSWTPSVLSFETINNNSVIKVIGGTAKNLIFGKEYKSYNGTIDAKGLILGNIRVEHPVTWAATNPSQLFGLPYKLGNCATTPKTLLIEVDNTQYTVTFTRNYMTTDGSAYGWNTTPAINNSSIINEINSQHPTIFKAFLAEKGTEMGTFEDCQEYGLNASNETLLTGMAVIKDFSGILVWRKAQDGEIAEGIVSERINIQSGNILNSGRIILANKALFLGSLLGATNMVGGKMYKVNSNGYLSETTDKSIASFIAIDKSYLKSMK